MRTGRTIRDETRLRKEPDHGAEVLRLLPSGAEVEVLEEQAHFFQVRWRDRFSELTGYIAKGFLAADAGEPPESEPGSGYLLPCPRCGTKHWHLFPLEQSGSHGFSQNLHIPTGFLSGVPVQARVCLRCGYLEYCVDDEGVQELRDLLARG